MEGSEDRRLSGRQEQARRNDGRVLAAAREVFTRDPGAPMSAVAKRAAVGQGSLYRRYAGKEALIASVCADGMARMRDAAVAALEDGGDAWTALSDFLRWYLESGTAQLAALVGTFSPDEELFDLARETNRVIQALVEKSIDAGRLRPDVSGADLTLLATLLSGLRHGEPERDAALRERYLTLLLQGLDQRDRDPLPGPAPEGEELERPWREAQALSVDDGDARRPE